MNNENEIERMAKNICKSSLAGCNFPTCSKCGIKDTCKARIYATRAVNAGYGNVKQAVKEFEEKLKEKFSKRISDLKNSEEECQEVGDWETAARCKVTYNEIENVLNGFNQLITELYGAEE